MYVLGIFVDIYLHIKIQLRTNVTYTKPPEKYLTLKKKKLPMNKVKHRVKLKIKLKFTTKTHILYGVYILRYDFATNIVPGDIAN